MLILTRKLGESIIIDDCICITVVAVQGNQVKLGIEAPADAKIYRNEVYAKIVEANRQAATTQPADLSTLPSWWEQWRASEQRRS